MCAAGVGRCAAGTGMGGVSLRLYCCGNMVSSSFALLGSRTVAMWQMSHTTVWKVCWPLSSSRWRLAAEHGRHKLWSQVSTRISSGSVPQREQLVALGPAALILNFKLN